MKRFVINRFKKKQNTDDVDGGVRKRFDSNAPKTIDCTKIVDFVCVFSTLTIADEPDLERSVFTLEANTVNASYKSRSEEFVFSTPSAFMEELQSIVSEYDFAQFNGITYHVSGLPDMFGATVSVKYESGECIYSANNQDLFIPLDAIKKMLMLFKKRKI